MRFEFEVYLMIRRRHFVIILEPFANAVEIIQRIEELNREANNGGQIHFDKMSQSIDNKNPTNIVRFIFYFFNLALGPSD